MLGINGVPMSASHPTIPPPPSDDDGLMDGGARAGAVAALAAPAAAAASHKAAARTAVVVVVGQAGMSIRSTESIDDDAVADPQRQSQLIKRTIPSADDPPSGCGSRPSSCTISLAVHSSRRGMLIDGRWG